MGACGEIVVRVAMTGRAGIDGSGGSSCAKLVGVRRESRGVFPYIGLWFVGRICPVWESAGGWFSSWRLKKSTSRDVDVDLFREEGRTRRRDLCRQVLQCLCAVEPARFQFSQCVPEGAAHYDTGSCVLTEC
ncbi:hypothetical protein Taro_034754, partial [Colocasia esculenta]|nr:hypothetical protein [Colocasia esculenta]